MNIIANPSLDCKTMIAILNANPDGVAIIGAWNSMETMAREDPEGCVRLCPDLPMDNAALATFFHCSEAIVAKTVEVFKKLKKLTVKDGLIKVPGCTGETVAAPRQSTSGNVVSAKTALTDTALAIKREKDRLRKARSRARQKQAKMTEMEDNVTSVTTCDNRDKCDSTCDTCDNVCDSNTIYPIYPLHPLHPLHAYKPISKYVDLNNLIPLKELPEECRNVIGEWNKLPLPKFKGLVPELLEKLEYLLQRYGQNTLCRTISGIANNAFLLGKKEGHTWTVSLGWLLEPGNFAKVLSGKYQDQQYGDSRFLSRRPGERLPFYLPGEGEERFTPKEQEQALRDLFIPTTPAQLKAARLLGLPGYEEATA
jgi:hypothetical protein